MILTVLALVFPIPSHAQLVREAFRDLLVNSVSTGQQVNPAVAADANGNFVAVWQDDRNENGFYEIHARGFDVRGVQTIPDFTVNSIASGQQLRPAVAADADGNFIVVWEDDQDENGFYEVLARGFDAQGNETFRDLTVNSVSSGQQLAPAVAADGQGTFVVVWEDDRDENGFYQIHARGFDVRGVQTIADFTVNSIASGQQLRPAVAADVDGNFIVVWEDDQDENGFYEILARGFDAQGNQTFQDFTVNSVSSGQQLAPAVAADEGGTFVVVWQDDKDENGFYQIHARGFDNRGNQAVADFTVNLLASGQQIQPAVAMNSGASFIVGWADDSNRNGIYEIKARGFHADGAQALPEFTVNSESRGQQLNPAVTSSDLGDFIVAWEDDRNENGVYEIHARGLFGSDSLGPDGDGDGLQDSWESTGLDTDNDGTIDLDLPALGANPNHKDLFLEFDWAPGQQPTQQAIARLKAAFAVAPMTAGGIANPDGLPGINLWVDTGTLTDPAGREDGALAGTCNDGIDNGGDLSADANDLDCLVGDNFGGGNLITQQVVCLDDSFYVAKAANFAAVRRLVFRYGISGDPAVNPFCGGGQGEIGGNDFVEYNHDAGTIMHELGHTLVLRHGGFENENHKPNYISVMNYFYQFGIPQVGANPIIDYSPPTSGPGRGQAPLPSLNESDLTEAIVVDPTDATSMMIYADGVCAIGRSAVSAAVDWNGDGDTVDIGLVQDIDSPPASCPDNSAQILAGHDDWNALALNFRMFADLEDGALNPVIEREPTLEELLDLRSRINEADLGVQARHQPQPVEAGATVEFHLTFQNYGPNQTDEAAAEVVLPSGLQFQTVTPQCEQSPSDRLACPLGAIPDSGLRARQIVAMAGAEPVRQYGSPAIVTVRVSLTNLVGLDPSLQNNTVFHDVVIVDTTLPELRIPASLSVEADTLGGAVVELPPATASDYVDSDPRVNCDRTSGFFPLGTTTITCRATDGSGNASEPGSYSVTVIDTRPPKLDLVLTPQNLWPPNHRMVDVAASVVAADIVDPSVSIVLTSVTSNESDDSPGGGDGHTRGDIRHADVGTPDFAIQLRAERSGAGDGRMYTLTYTATDGSGNAASISGLVIVPHN
jgi:hypothetical protein